MSNNTNIIKGKTSLLNVKKVNVKTILHQVHIHVSDDCCQHRLKFP